MIVEYSGFYAHAYSGVNTPAQTPDPSMAGLKRAPSSSVQLQIAIGAYVFMLFSWMTFMTSRADVTPTIPSYLPPAGCVSNHEHGVQLRVIRQRSVVFITEMTSHSDGW